VQYHANELKKLDSLGKALIENPEKAKYVLEVFLGINGQMKETLEIVEEGVSPEEYIAYRTALGHLIYEVFEKMIEPICKRHPSLKPAEMES
jgi:hypothetical protein